MIEQKRPFHLLKYRPLKADLAETAHHNQRIERRIIRQTISKHAYQLL